MKKGTKKKRIMRICKKKKKKKSLEDLILHPKASNQKLRTWLGGRAFTYCRSSS